MNSTYASQASSERTWLTRPQFVSLLGPAVSASGIVWAIMQPNRVTLLHPRGQGFWWLLIEPPLLVVIAGIVFAVVVARPLLADLEKHRATSR
jgi:hypothetical protein